MKRHFGKYLGPTLIDEAQPLTAWRTWRICRLPNYATNSVRLTGTWASQWIWAPHGGVSVAECLKDGKTGKKKTRCNVTMDPACDCGLWATIALTNLLKHGAIALYPTGLLGRVHLWGFVHVYEFGFRASMGRPVDCWLGNSAGKADAELIRQTYAVPVDLGLPVEVVVDQDLLTPAKVLEAANAYMGAQGVVAAAALPRVAPPPPPSPAAPAWKKRLYHHCRGCGKPGRIDRCQDCKAKV